MNEPRNNSELSFLAKVWIFAAVISLLAILIFFFRASVHIFILILVGALIACYFRGLGNLIKRKTGWSERLSLLISVLTTFIFVSGITYLIGATLSNQTVELKENLPELIDKAKVFMEETAVGKQLGQYTKDMHLSENSGKYLSGLFKTTFGGIGDIFVILLIGIYFTISPKVYKDGILQLIPPRKRPTAEHILLKLSSNLTKWLFGKFISMSLIFVMTAIALAIIGTPVWLALAFIAGILVFIPNFGPIISAIPALLVALSVSERMAFIVLILYIVIQLSEGAVITPKIQDRLVKIPPALIILGQIFAGTLLGVWGLVFATPIVLIIKTLIEELYIFPMNKNFLITKKDEKT